MANYQNDHAEAVTFPSIIDDKGNSLVVEPGATFTGPDDLNIAGITPVAVGKKGKTAEPAPEIPAAPAEDEPIAEDE
jgi:hypothetical protein